MPSYKQSSNLVLAVGVVLLAVVLECNAQTLTYSSGWTNGKRSPPDATPFGHHEHAYSSGPVLISDIQSGRNFVCFDVNPQIKDTLISYGLKSPDYPRPLVPRPLLRTPGE